MGNTSGITSSMITSASGTIFPTRHRERICNPCVFTLHLRRWFRDAPTEIRIRQCEGEVELKNITVDMSAMQRTRECTLRLAQESLFLEVQPQDERFVQELNRCTRQAQHNWSGESASSNGSQWRRVCEGRSGEEALEARGSVKLMVPGLLGMQWRTASIRVLPNRDENLQEGNLEWSLARSFRGLWSLTRGAGSMITGWNAVQRLSNDSGSIFVSIRAQAPVARLRIHGYQPAATSRFGIGGLSYVDIELSSEESLRELVLFMKKSVRHVVPRGVSHSIGYDCDMVHWLPRKSSARVLMRWTQGWVILEGNGEVELKFYSTLGRSTPLQVFGMPSRLCRMVRRGSTPNIMVKNLKIQPWEPLSHDKASSALAGRTLELHHKPSPNASQGPDFAALVLRFQTPEQQEWWAKALLEAKLRSASSTVLSLEHQPRERCLTPDEYVRRLAQHPDEHVRRFVRTTNFQTLCQYMFMMAEEPDAPPFTKEMLNMVMVEPARYDITQVIVRLIDVFIDLTLNGGTFPLCTSVMQDARWRRFTEECVRFVSRFFTWEGGAGMIRSGAKTDGVLTWKSHTSSRAVLAILLCCDLLNHHAHREIQHTHWSERCQLTSRLQHKTVVERARIVNHLVHSMHHWVSLGITGLSQSPSEGHMGDASSAGGTEVKFLNDLIEYLESHCFPDADPDKGGHDKSCKTLEEMLKKIRVRATARTRGPIAFLTQGSHVMSGSHVTQEGGFARKGTNLKQLRALCDSKHWHLHKAADFYFEADVRRQIFRQDKREEYEQELVRNFIHAAQELRASLAHDWSESALSLLPFDSERVLDGAVEDVPLQMLRNPECQAEALFRLTLLGVFDQPQSMEDLSRRFAEGLSEKDRQQEESFEVLIHLVRRFATNTSGSSGSSFLPDDLRSRAVRVWLDAFIVEDGKVSEEKRGLRKQSEDIPDPLREVLLRALLELCRNLWELEPQRNIEGWFDSTTTRAANTASPVSAPDSHLMRRPLRRALRRAVHDSQLSSMDVQDLRTLLESLAQGLLGDIDDLHLGSRVAGLQKALQERLQGFLWLCLLVKQPQSFASAFTVLTDDLPSDWRAVHGADLDSDAFAKVVCDVLVKHDLEVSQIDTKSWPEKELLKLLQNLKAGFFEGFTLFTRDVTDLASQGGVSNLSTMVKEVLVETPDVVAYYLDKLLERSFPDNQKGQQRVADQKARGLREKRQQLTKLVLACTRKILDLLQESNTTLRAAADGMLAPRSDQPDLEIDRQAERDARAREKLLRSLKKLILLAVKHDRSAETAAEKLLPKMASFLQDDETARQQFIITHRNASERTKPGPMPQQLPRAPKRAKPLQDQAKKHGLAKAGPGASRPTPLVPKLHIPTAREEIERFRPGLQDSATIGVFIRDSILHEMHHDDPDLADLMLGVLAFAMYDAWSGLNESINSSDVAVLSEFGRMIQIHGEIFQQCILEADSFVRREFFEILLDGCCQPDLLPKYPRETSCAAPSAAKVPGGYRARSVKALPREASSGQAPPRLPSSRAASNSSEATHGWNVLSYPRPNLRPTTASHAPPRSTLASSSPTPTPLPNPYPPFLARLNLGNVPSLSTARLRHSISLPSLLASCYLPSPHCLPHPILTSNSLLYSILHPHTRLPRAQPISSTYPAPSRHPILSSRPIPSARRHLYVLLPHLKRLPSNLVQASNGTWSRLMRAWRSGSGNWRSGSRSWRSATMGSRQQPRPLVDRLRLHQHRRSEKHLQHDRSTMVGPKAV